VVYKDVGLQYYFKTKGKALKSKDYLLSLLRLWCSLASISGLGVKTRKPGDPSSKW
tara:strand:+ start:2024 stop:2191 length:168 start_codon:yes stop_codon:yes gene_type:complete